MSSADLVGGVPARAQPPTSERALLARARQLAGYTLEELARDMGLDLPSEARRAKGWVGALLERALGADAGSRDEPDFRALGVELKTIPLDRDGCARESTFVCTAELDRIADLAWERSRVRRKLRRVLWVPVETHPGQPFAARRVGSALLWSPTAEQQAQLREDWDELVGVIGTAGLDAIHAGMGNVLQIRPKAAHARVRRTVADAEGLLGPTLPRGFYLRARFTRTLFEELRRPIPSGPGGGPT